MGLRKTLTKENNHLNFDFTNAYWAISDLSYDTGSCYFRLKAYPSREAKIKDLSPVEKSTLSFGGASYPVVNSALYVWEGIFPIADIFPAGIPLDEDLQKKVIYNFIKKYTAENFTDVFEEGQN